MFYNKLITLIVLFMSSLGRCNAAATIKQNAPRRLGARQDYSFTWTDLTTEAYVVISAAYETKYAQLVSGTVDIPYTTITHFSTSTIVTTSGVTTHTMAATDPAVPTSIIMQGLKPTAISQLK